MSEKKHERKKVRAENPTEPKTKETKKGKQTKFIIDVGDLAATPDELDKVRSALLKTSIEQLKGMRSAGGGPAERPNIGTEFFSLSFSLSFSLGA